MAKVAMMGKGLEQRADIDIANGYGHADRGCKTVSVMIEELTTGGAVHLLQAGHYLSFALAI